MLRELQLVVDPQTGYHIESLHQYVHRHLGLSPHQQLVVRLKRRSIDARGKTVRINIEVEAFVDEIPPQQRVVALQYKAVHDAQEVIVAGAGPAGLFAALRLIELGLKPIVLERGKDVRSRRRDLAAINREHMVNPDSNYCFGEGGAGTYSDGKLYTRSNKRGSIEGVLNTFFAHGAVEEILIDTHPHIGTNKLPGIIVSMRETILRCGGEIHFNSRITGIEKSSGSLKAVVVAEQVRIPAKALILATGHSARDIYQLLHAEKIQLEFKPFALGVRAEHPQELIDQIQYHCQNRGDYLPPASYALVEQIQQRGVYSFCMCPGGIVAPCATAPGEVVTNGWSPSKRNNPFANSGIVVEIREEDAHHFAAEGPLSGMYFQQSIEQQACRLAGGRQSAPAQRMVDFVQGRVSSTLPESSYQPGIVSVDLVEVLPAAVAKRLQGAFKAFGQKMKGYYSNEAVLHAVESRTSTPVRIPRNSESLMHEGLQGLFPCGEGAGYAGGIVSAAMDGQKCAEAVARFFNMKEYGIGKRTT
jgi:uncharacterized FAD-dependent dehydrogenase